MERYVGHRLILGLHEYDGRSSAKRHLAGRKQAQAREGLDSVLLPSQLTLPLGLEKVPNFVRLVVHLDRHIQSAGEVIALRVQPPRRTYPTPGQLELREVARPLEV